jgi:FkbM family methyltransferase
MNKPIQAIYFRDFPNAHIPEILDEVYLKKIYEPFLLGKKDLTIVDIGANIGLTSYYFRDYAKMVYSIEPSKQHYDTLTEMITFNKINNITCSRLAISNQNGTTKFYHNDNSTMFSMESTVNKKDDFEEVVTMTLENYMAKYKIEKIDLLKLDTEGSESKIIVSDGFKNVADKIKLIVGEYHEWTEMNKGMFKREFEELGFTFNWNYKTQASVFSAIRL